MAAKNEKLSISEQINDFLQKNRKFLIFGLIAIIVVVVVFVAVSTVRDQLNSQALSSVDELNRRYEAIKSNIENESTENINKLLADLLSFAKSNSGYAASRSYAIRAGIYEIQKNWAEAESNWINAAKAGGKTYLAPVAYYNAAVAAEENGNLSRAIELYNEALQHEKVFPAAPRALFSIARLQESQGDKSGALASYSSLVSKWPQDLVWVNLAHSRIISLSSME